MTADVRADRFHVDPSVGSHFSWINTRLAIERTFMAGMRTAVSLIGFGFTIVQFFQRVQTGAAGQSFRPQAPRELGLALIATGVGSLIIASIQYRRMIGYLWLDQFKPIAGLTEKPRSTPMLAAALVIMLIGVAAFGTVFLHIA
jgi:putative membrane protein